MKDLVLVRTFLNKHEAEIAKGLLSDQAIEAVISLDDVGGHLPEFALISGGIKLLVKKEDVERAESILNEE